MTEIMFLDHPHTILSCELTRGMENLRTKLSILQNNSNYEHHKESNE